jgi:hypothetical protein
MSVEGRVHSLERRHRELEAAIRDEDHRPAPDADRLHHLKVEKLHVKEELDRLDG